MPSKYGGVPVESSGSKFGGIPVDDDIQRIDSVEVRPDPTEGSSFYENYRAGLGKSMVDTYEGGKQTLTDMARYFVEENGLLFDDETAQELRDLVQRQQAKQAERQRLDEPLNATAGGKLGNIVGTAAQILGPGMTFRGTAATSTFLPRTVAGNATQGAVVGALQPVTGEGQRMTNAGIGAASGMVGAGVPKLVGAGVNAVRGLSPAVSKQMQERAAAGVINQFAADPAAVRLAAQNPNVIIPGSMPTLAEASGDVGMAGLQRTLANTPEYANALKQRNEANNLARVQAIEGGFGGADEAASASIRGSRDAAANVVLRPAASVPMSSLNKVLAGVSRLAEKNPANEAVQTAMEAVKTRLPLVRNVKDAHDVRQYVNQLIGGQVEGKAGAKFAKGQLLTVRGLLDREMRAAYPEWGTFLRDHKALSREADRVDVGAELLGTGRAVRSATNQPDLTPAAFGRAAGNLDRTVQRATGFGKATADRTLTPDQIKVVDDVRRDLERYSRASLDGKAIGSNTMQNAVGGNRLQDAAGPVGAAMIEPASGIAMMAVNAMRKNYGEKVAVIVQEAMLDPARAAEILATLPAKNRTLVVRDFARITSRIGGVSGVVAPTLAE